MRREETALAHLAGTCPAPGRILRVLVFLGVALGLLCLHVFADHHAPGHHTAAASSSGLEHAPGTAETTATTHLQADHPGGHAATDPAAPGNLALALDLLWVLVLALVGTAYRLLRPGLRWAARPRLRPVALSPPRSVLPAARTPRPVDLGILRT